MNEQKRIEMQPFSYADDGTPDGYFCGKCSASGVKLWREYSMFLNHQSLFCIDCACTNQNKPRIVELKTERYEAYGHCLCRAIKVFDESEFDNDFERESFASGDQIGWLVPAVPTEEGDTFWGYSSVPQAGVEWWHRLAARAALASAESENKHP